MAVALTRVRRASIICLNVAFGAQTTLAYSENAVDNAGIWPMTDGSHPIGITLLGNYMAG